MHKSNKSYMKQLWDNIYNDLPIKIVFLFIGFLLAFLVFNSQPLLKLQLKPEVSVVEITNLVLTLCLAIFLPFYFSKKINNKRIEKDLLIVECDKLINELYSLRVLIEDLMVRSVSIRNKKEIAETLILRNRNISNLLNTLNENTKSYQKNNDIAALSTSLIANQLKYGNDLTLNLRDNPPKITPETYVLTENNMNDYARNINKLKLYINMA